MENTQKDARRFEQMLLIVGGLFVVNTLVFVTEYTLLKAEMSLIEQKLQLAITNQVGDGSVFAYATSVALWTILLGVIVGYVWSKILFPSLPYIEKFMASLVLGVFVMPLSFVIPAFIVSVRKLGTDIFGWPLPDYYNATIGQLVNLFGGNQEQGYELFNVLLFLVLGICIVGIMQLKNKKQLA